MITSWDLYDAIMDFFADVLGYPTANGFMLFEWVGGEYVSFLPHWISLAVCVATLIAVPLIVYFILRWLFRYMGGKKR